MSTLKVDSLVNGGKTIDFTYNAKVSNGTLKKEYYEQSTEPAYPCDGALWFNTSDDTFHTYANGGWYATTVTLPPTVFGDRGIFGGLYISGNVIDYISIPTTGNAIDFGDLSTANRADAGTVSSGSRGVFGGGLDGFDAYTNIIDYITISTPSNATDFGDLTAAAEAVAGASNGTRGLFAGGYAGGGSANALNTIQYITIATTGNATDFGDLIGNRSKPAGCSSALYGIFAGGYNGSYHSNIDYVTIATTGNAQDFGDLTLARYQAAGGSNGVRGLIGGGWGTSDGTSAYADRIDYITMATPGNATDFGNLTARRWGLAGAANQTRMTFAGGYFHPTTYNTIDYITIANTGNATDFGDLTVARYKVDGLSGN